MASFSQVTKRKRARRRKNAGRARKRKIAERSTPTAEELFAHLGAIGQAAPAVGKVVRAGAVAQATARAAAVARAARSGPPKQTEAQ